ncbi:hypothetical protein BpHYR1_041125 [Brachionus plicatilis]|uniref:Uncharacterized protein n=1 Tax=Brachionus plicatilis TaxID=10195 RepID=A0A3M7S3M3_BRAPC|nr:hypothetical protein BpHYR1_041125 [Brachionus plicatilis]
MFYFDLFQKRQVKLGTKSNKIPHSQKSNKDATKYVGLSCSNTHLTKVDKIDYLGRCHMKDVLKCLQIFNIDELYIQSKLSFLGTLKFNKLSYDIFHDLTN